MTLLEDKWDRRGLRLVITLFVVIIITNIIYFKIIPYLEHDPAVHISIIVGFIIAIIPQVALHKLMSRRKNNRD